MTELGPHQAPAPVPFPPVGNPYIIGIATGSLGGAGLPTDQLDEVGMALEGIESGSATPFEVRDLVLAAVMPLLAEVNSQFFRFELSGLAEGDQPIVLRPTTQPLELHALALSDARSTRKLTVLLPISVPEDTTVDIEFPTFDKAKSLARGEAAVFPSYMVPMVTLSDGRAEAEALLLALSALGPAFV